jgi:hypothetical protein
VEHEVKAAVRKRVDRWGVIRRVGFGSVRAWRAAHAVE